MYNVDITPGLLNKLMSLLLIFDLVRTSSFACIFFVALCPYVSMGIVAYLGQPRATYNVGTESDHVHCGKHTSISVVS